MYTIQRHHIPNEIVLIHITTEKCNIFDKKKRTLKKSQKKDFEVNEADVCKVKISDHKAFVVVAV